MVRVRVGDAVVRNAVGRKLKSRESIIYFDEPEIKHLDQHCQSYVVVYTFLNPQSGANSISLITIC